VWQVREASLGAISHVPGEPLSWGGWEDSSVAPADLGAYLRELRQLMDRYGYSGALYGHFGHACVHTRTNFDLESKQGIGQYRRFMEEAADLVVGYGGSLSGEHGDGQQRAELLPRMFGEELVAAFRQFKALWDPEWKMNPGKLVEPYKLDENLRLGADYRPWQPATHFQYPEDQGSLARATLRCVGFGKCRQQQGGLMCPSFQVTGEELHSTRGRAHLLWEMTQGTLIEPGWNNEAVKESLDLCLACKGCKSDCPVGVDVATYKAEFLAHYYEGRARPRSAYAFAYIDRWARWASQVPGFVNLATQLPLSRALLKRAANLDGERQIPPLAPRSFRRWFEKRATGAGASGNPPVLLWTDTFNNHFLPETLQAAVEVLERARFRVLLPPANLCCGRPLYDFGMLERARRLLRQILDQLAPAIARKIPIVVLEPSCAAVFRDELLNLFPDDPRAQQLGSQVFLLSEFLEQSAPHFPLPRLLRKALVHGHCHHKALMKMTANDALLTRMGIEFESPAAGCCGMAGSFGFEKHTRAVASAIGELELLPAVRKAPPEWLIIADGFSCREQIAQSSERGALHLAEVIQMGFNEGYEPIPPLYPERDRARARKAGIERSMRRAGLGLLGLSAAAACWVARKSQTSHR
jgi:Fe-S oxidoreductase